MRRLLPLFAAVGALTLPVHARAADAPGAATVRTDGSYVALGPSAEADLAKLREALAKLPGVEQVDLRGVRGGVAVRVRGEAGVSLLAAASRRLGFVLRPAPVRSFAAAGPAGETDRSRLREALARVAGVDRVEAGPHPSGAALRISGPCVPAEVVAAGRDAGFTLQQLGAYAASGPGAPADLARLKAALSKSAGVDRIEMQPLTGGATLLVHGDVEDGQLVSSARSAGYALWPLAEAAGARQFGVAGAAPDLEKLPDALRKVDGIGEIEIRPAAAGPRLVVTGGRARPDAIRAAASAAGVSLTPIEEVKLPTLVPAAGRNTPPDFDERVLEDQAKPGGPAPDFTLVMQDGTSTLSLSSYRGNRPVVLLFGSCT